jgi:hypothetical protein
LPCDTLAKCHRVYIFVFNALKREKEVDPGSFLPCPLLIELSGLNKVGLGYPLNAIVPFRCPGNNPVCRTPYRFLPLAPFE